MNKSIELPYDIWSTRTKNYLFLKKREIGLSIHYIKNCNWIHWFVFQYI